ncbi:hypothetical protein [Geotalea toluenoxydans]
MAEKKKYDEQRELPSPWEWVIITLLSLVIIAYGLLAYRFVLDGPRQWDFGQLPDTPAESIYSTEEPPPRDGKLPRQLPKLPEAQPENPPKPPNQQLRERSPNR